MSQKTRKLREARANNKAYVAEYRKLCHCKLCGDTSKIEFHRVEDVIKLHDAVRKYTNIHKVISVIESCIPVCPECHKMLEDGVEE